MSTDPETAIGAAWLAARHAIQPVAPLATLSRIGRRRASRTVEGAATETYVEAMRPQPNLREHLTFHLKAAPTSMRSTRTRWPRPRRAVWEAIRAALEAALRHGPGGDPARKRRP